MPFIKYLYTDIKFKLTPARKIEIRLTKSSDTSILTHYYKLKNGVFYRISKNNWIEADVGWFEPVQSIYKQTLFQTKSLWRANLQSCKFIYCHYENRPKSEIIGSGLNYKSAKYPFFYLIAEHYLMELQYKQELTPFLFCQSLNGSKKGHITL